ncbi:MAG: hypothetical protein AAF135_00425 [Bacteroidota bacterium]
MITQLIEELILAFQLWSRMDVVEIESIEISFPDHETVFVR